MKLMMQTYKSQLIKVYKQNTEKINYKTFNTDHNLDELKRNGILVGRILNFIHEGWKTKQTLEACAVM